MRPTPPATVEELLARARALAGLTLADVARAHAAPLPKDPVRSKGWVGQLIEHVLGARAGSRAEPDFAHLGVELKTIPVDVLGRPRESTYVCTAPLTGDRDVDWQGSWVRTKLQRVLWLPIVGDRPGPERRIGTAFLWTPSEEEEAQLRADWEAVADLVASGETWHLGGRHGEALQLRPKAASARDRTLVVGADGEDSSELPRGWYLRPSFTGAVIARNLRLPRAAGPAEPRNAG